MFVRLLVWVVALLAVAAGVVAWWVQRPLALAHDAIEISIEPGTSVRDIVRLWHDAGVQEDPRLLYQWFRWSGDARRIQAGSYEVTRGVTPHSLLEKMVRGDAQMQALHIIDGWTVRQMRAALASAPGLRPTTATLTDVELMTKLGASAEPAEGRFYPDTYLYTDGVSDLLVLERAHAAMARHLAEAWAARPADSPLKTPADALALASVVEKETGQKTDLGKVAGVFTNRLRLGMPLQSDPTIIYGLGATFDGDLHKADLQRDAPYNSYTRAGLPPTPIALPGRQALLAAVRPEATKALYFVARGDGTSEFSETLDAHNRAVNQFQRAQHQ